MEEGGEGGREKGELRGRVDEELPWEGCQKCMPAACLRTFASCSRSSYKE